MPTPCGWRCAAARAISSLSRSRPTSWSPCRGPRCATSLVAAMAAAQGRSHRGARRSRRSRHVDGRLQPGPCAGDRRPGAPTLLLDLDVNAAPLASLLDLTPERGLPAALAEVESLDEHALPGYVAKHRSGLHLMGAPAKSLVSAKDLDPARFATLMGILAANYQHIVVDASHTARRPERRDARHGAGRWCWSCSSPSCS